MGINSSDVGNMWNEVFTNGVAFSNRYEVLIFPPSFFGPDATRQLAIRCESVVIPGRSLSTAQYRFYGPTRNMPYESLYSGEISLTMILSANLYERRFFERWMDFIVSNENYKFKYYNEYIGSMQITAIDRTNTPIYSVQLEEVYPKMLSDIAMGYDKNDEIIKQDITLNYRKYSVIG